MKATTSTAKPKTNDLVRQRVAQSVSESLARGIEACLLHNNRLQAHALVDKFFNLHAQERRKTLEYGDPVSMLVADPRLADMLDRAGYRTVGAVAAATLDELKSIWQMGEIRIKEIHDALKQNGFSAKSAIAPKKARLPL